MSNESLQLGEGDIESVRRAIAVQLRILAQRRGAAGGEAGAGDGAEG